MPTSNRNANNNLWLKTQSHKHWISNQKWKYEILLWTQLDSHSINTHLFFLYFSLPFLNACSFDWIYSALKLKATHFSGWKSKKKTFLPFIICIWRFYYDLIAWIPFVSSVDSVLSIYIYTHRYADEFSK